MPPCRRDSRRISGMSSVGPAPRAADGPPLCGTGPTDERPSAMLTPLQQSARLPRCGVQRQLATWRPPGYNQVSWNRLHNGRWLRGRGAGDRPRHRRRSVLLRVPLLSFTLACARPRFALPRAGRVLPRSWTLGARRGLLALGGCVADFHSQRRGGAAEQHFSSPFPTLALHCGHCLVIV